MTLTNHLGNVLALIGDRKQKSQQSTQHQAPEVVNLTDYYPFGMVMPGRSYAADVYRYGYQGSEKDDEMAGQGNSYTTHFRQLDSRIARWFSVDPKANPMHSTYASMGLNPIFYNDQLGDTIRVTRRFQNSKVFREMRRDFREQTGLNIHVREDDNGRYLDYSATGKNGEKEPTSYSGNTSATARGLLMTAIDHDNTVVFDVSRKRNNQVNGNIIVFNGDVIDELMYNLQYNSDLNPKTTGYGIAAYHELNHWLNGSAANDPPFNSNFQALGENASSVPGPTVGVVNAIRSELTAAGQGNYGARTSYFLMINKLKVITFSQESREQIMSSGKLRGVRDYTFIPLTGSTETDGQKNYEK